MRASYRVTAVVGQATAHALEREAKQRGRLISPLVRQIIEEHFERQQLTQQRDANGKRQP